MLKDEVLTYSSYAEEQFDVIFLSAGTGTRVNLGYPKQFYAIANKPIILFSLEIFQSMSQVKNIYIACTRETLMKHEELLTTHGITKAKLVLGGNTRQESVYNTLPYVTSKRLIIHEAARPFISEELVLDLLSYKDSVVVPTLPVAFTVLEGQDYATKILQRKNLKNIQLPQIFDSIVLKEIHQKAKADNFLATEDSMMAFHYGYKVRFVPGLEENIKITTPLDLLFAKCIAEDKIS